MTWKRMMSLSAVIALLFGSRLCSAQGDNLQPKYGSLPITKGQKESNKVFIAEMDDEYHGDRAKAAAFLSGRGWQYLSGGDDDTAMKRFNQAWLLDAKNGNALWGMAAIEASRSEFDEALKLLAEAEKVVGDNLNFQVDHAKIIGMLAVKRNDSALLADATTRFAAISKKAPQNVRNLQNWAVTLSGVGRYSEAWEKVKLAEASPDHAILDKRVVVELEAHLPRPIE